MKDFQLRMLDEQNNLQDKVFKLTKFININPEFKSLSKEEQSDMKRQLKGMRIYLDSLTSRIDRFKSLNSI